jgi:tripartite-type tricarboxylate transporter receptor subunit TctC
MKDRLISKTMGFEKGGGAMRKMSVVISIFAAMFLFPWWATGMAADFPQKPIRLIIPWSSGGGTDIIGRAFQPFFEKILGQRVLIDNIPGGTTKIGAMELIKAKPDGHTLIFSPTESWVGYYYSKTYDFKAWQQMTPIANITSEPYGFVEARTDSPYKTWADLVKAGKENPGKLVCAGPGAGGMIELIMTKITAAAGFKARYVPFAGAGPSKLAVLGGHADFRVCGPGDAIGMIRAGKTRGLAVSSEKRMEALPDVPTFKELGIGGVISVTRSIWGPPKLPANIVNTLTKIVEKATKDPEFIKIIQNQLHTVDYRPPEKMKEDLETFNKEFGPGLAEMYK